MRIVINIKSECGYSSRPPTEYPKKEEQRHVSNDRKNRNVNISSTRFLSSNENRTIINVKHMA